MGSKTVILGVLVMSLVMAQTQIEAQGWRHSCCPTVAARFAYNQCRYAGKPLPGCAYANGCKWVEGLCPDGYVEGELQHTRDDVVNEYCKLGCVSSVCAAITTLQSTDESEIVNGAVGQCTKACSTLCTKGSTTTPGTATA